MILCLEGASVVGKTTCCRALEDRLGTAVISEVNALFIRPPSAPEDWYLERQAERYALARAASEDASLGDLGRRPVPAALVQLVVRLLQAAHRKRGDGFPDRYSPLVADEATLRERREADQTRRRRNFERHLWLMEALPRYFGAVAAPLLIEVTAADRVQRRCQPPSR